jgi:hypothetical protein
MTLSTKPLIAAAGLALVSVAAHAQLPNPAAFNTTTFPASTGLYVAVYDSAGSNSELVNLGYDSSVTTFASGNLTPNSANADFSLVNAPTGSGQVLQLNFGTIPGFGTLFTSANASTTEFMILGANTGGVQVTDNSAPTFTSGGLSTATQSIQQEIAAWAEFVPPTGDLQDTTGTQPYSVKSGPLAGGLLAGDTLYTGLNTVLDFWNVVAGSGRGSQPTNHQYANSTGAGYWFLTSAGDLTYNVPTTTTVPLPPALWLLGSGLLGLAGISRRRVAG